MRVGLTCVVVLKEVVKSKEVCFMVLNTLSTIKQDHFVVWLGILPFMTDAVAILFLKCLGLFKQLGRADGVMKHLSVHPVTGMLCALPQATQLVGTAHSRPENPTRNTLWEKAQFSSNYILAHIQDASVLLVAQCAHINFGNTSEKSLITGASQ